MYYTVNAILLFYPDTLFLQQYTLLEINKPMAGYQLKVDKCSLLSPFYHMVTLNHLKISTVTKPLTSCVFSSSHMLSLITTFWLSMRCSPILHKCVSIYNWTKYSLRSKKIKVSKYLVTTSWLKDLVQGKPSFAPLPVKFVHWLVTVNKLESFPICLVP